MNYPRVASFKTVGDFRRRLRELGIEMPVDEHILSGPSSPLGQPMRVGSVVVGNRFCIHPMEGWDGTPDGRPSELTLGRWRRFGASGAKLIWGGEAAAVRHDGRANPRQLCCRAENEMALGELREALVAAHRERFGDTSDLLVGLQLTHSGRYSRPNDPGRPEPRIAYHHPLLDARLGIAPDDASVVLADDELRRIIDRFIDAAKMAARIGFGFVDIKHCHGYLGHELLSAYDRPGDFGGSFENRTRFLREIAAGVRAQCPGLMIGVRLSAFDTSPFVRNNCLRPEDRPDAGSEFTLQRVLRVVPGEDTLKRELPTQASGHTQLSCGAEDSRGRGVPVSPPPGPYPAFGCDRVNPLRIDLAEPIRLLQLMRDELAIELVNLSAGSPYSNPHIQRPALFPPSDGYLPPEDPLVSCARQLEVARELRRSVPGLPMVGTAYTYFQEYLPQIAQAAVREGWIDFVGLGRMALSYPDLPADVLQTGRLDPRRLCRTFSDCTTAPRAGLVSGCYPLDPVYKKRPEWQQLKVLKAEKGKAGSEGR